jgi:hypothetical protein
MEINSSKENPAWQHLGVKCFNTWLQVNKKENEQIVTMPVNMGKNIVFHFYEDEIKRKCYVVFSLDYLTSKDEMIKEVNDFLRNGIMLEQEKYVFVFVTELKSDILKLKKLFETDKLKDSGMKKDADKYNKMFGYVYDSKFVELK